MNKRDDDKINRDGEPTAHKQVAPLSGSKQLNHAKVLRHDAVDEKNRPANSTAALLE
jgi:hypothetical protein